MRCAEPSGPGEELDEEADGPERDDLVEALGMDHGVDAGA
jgi:hypothetical protein